MHHSMTQNLQQLSVAWDGVDEGYWMHFLHSLWNELLVEDFLD